MRVGRIVGFAVVLHAFALAALANPYVVEMTYGLQVPETFHAQITYAFDSNEPSGTAGAPTGLVRNGKSLSPTFLQDSITVNAGSGLAGFDAYQACDCNLPPGEYQYSFVFAKPPDEYSMAGKTIYVTITDPPPGPAEPDPEVASSSEEEEIPLWKIPAGPWPKGVDCVAWCADLPNQGFDVVGENDDTATTGGKKNSGGCTAGGTGGPGGLVALFAGLVALSRIRRRLAS